MDGSSVLRGKKIKKMAAIGLIAIASLAFLFAIYLLIIGIVPGISVKPQPITAAGSQRNAAAASEVIQRADVSFDFDGSALTAWLYLVINIDRSRMPQTSAARFCCRFAIMICWCLRKRRKNPLSNWDGMPQSSTTPSAILIFTLRTVLKRRPRTSCLFSTSIYHKPCQSWVVEVKTNKS